MIIVSKSMLPFEHRMHLYAYASPAFALSMRHMLTSIPDQYAHPLR